MRCSFYFSVAPKGGSPSEEKSYKVPYYTWSDSDGEHRTIGLKGHVLNPAFPEGYSNWQETDLHDLIDAEQEGGEGGG